MFHKNLLKAVGLGVAAALAIALPATGSAQTPQLQVRGQLKYVHGINVGWFFGRYSTDIGTNPLNPSWGNGYSSSTANAWLNDIKNMKANVVRLWLFEGCEGLVFDSSGYVSGLQSSFLTNLDDLMNKADTHGLAYELSLVNHDLNDQFGQTLPNGAVMRNFVTDATARQRFLDNAVGPLASRYNGRLAVFGYDVVNEVNYLISRGVCNQSQMRTFVQAVRDKIKSVSSGSKVTCSTDQWKWGDSGTHNGYLGGLGLDYYEFHSYATNPNLNTVPGWLDKPLLIGECGPSLLPPNYSGSVWTEADQNTAINNHIDQARFRGYAGTMPWMYYSAAGNGENLARTAGGNQDWESGAWTFKWWGDQFNSGGGGGGGGTTVSVYADALASDWSNWSWSTTVNLTDTTRAYAGSRSIKATSTAGWSALSLRKGTAQSTAGTTKLQFFVYTPNSARTFLVQIQTADSGGASSEVSVTSTANAWKQVTINLSALGNPSAIKRINIKSGSGSSIGDHWVDKVELIP
ncbi:MAG: cellulase family glycosylhydrolase [Fimbriimonadaceae bacterium]|nr:cellulase family glycosylhydrolase [Fimbriimonadaceae bacterium]